MTKFSRDNDQGMSAIVHFIANRARNAIAESDAQARAAYATPLPQHPTEKRSKNEEDKLAILKQCDTVFLVDDSPSMRGRGWELVQQILEYSMTVATWYDRNGIDVHFFNDWDSNQNELNDHEKAIRVLKSVDLNGDSPLYDQLCRHLDDYWSRFEKDGRKLEFKNYNLIILTDGEPKEEYESSDEISDQEDARKNKAAFRMIRKKIVDVARQLDKANARPKQIGIQFCQIGDDRDANVFFQYLDNDIKRNYKLKRDMVDTIKCVSELDLTPEWYEKLLLGGIDKRLDHEHVGSEASNSKSPPKNGASNRISTGSSWSLPSRTKSTNQSLQSSMTGDETLVGSTAGHVSSMPNISSQGSSRLQTLREAQQANYPATTSEQFEQSPSRMTYADRQRTLPSRPRVPEADPPQPQRSETFQPQKPSRSTSWRPWSRG
ncbi:MAG: hypothetical protein Q9214_002280 [Letrouitia sp. 1 TL-2023]